MAMDFDGDGDYIDCGADPAFDITDEITVAAWANIISIPTQWGLLLPKVKTPGGFPTWEAQGPSTLALLYGRLRILPSTETPRLAQMNGIMSVERMMALQSIYIWMEQLMELSPMQQPA